MNSERLAQIYGVKASIVPHPTQNRLAAVF
jgi:hypothetical protein